MTKIVELYGIATTESDANSIRDWPTIIKSQECPFLSRKCLKNRKSSPELTIGTCTVCYGKSQRNIMICPFRLLERNQIFEDCKALVTLHQAGNEWHIIPELNVPGGSIDYCLASVRRKKVVDFVGIELQTLDTTGTVWPERQRFAHEHGVKVNSADRTSSKPFGMNWKMTSKTILVQLHHKVATFEHLSKKLVLVVQNHLLDYMKREFSFGHLQASRLGDPMHFHAYSLEEDNGSLNLQLTEQRSTDAAGIAACLGLQSEAKLELAHVIEQIESKLTAKTLMGMKTPPIPPSVSEAADE